MSCSCFGDSTVLKRQGHKHDRPTESKEEGASIGKTKNFSYNEIKLATNDFHRSNKIGRGGFGTVYKGRLKSGREIAVKMLATESKQGVREFLTEIEALSDVHHPNLVELIGCCVHGSNRILVYEYLENNSLDRVLLGTRRSLSLAWAQRSAICKGTARGLAYLHHELVPHIVHRDIKASNILLDKNFNPKIGDFGLAKLFPDDITHISTKIAGTTGYLAPEYVLGGQLTPKADVYSFGVLILEIVSGRSSAHTNYGGPQKLLLELAWELYQEGKLRDLVDPEVEGAYPEDEVLRYMKVALFCTQSNSGRRPSMSQVVEMLSKNVKLNETQLTPPGFFEDSDRHNGKASKNKLSEASTSRQMSSFPSIITEVAPR